MSSPLTPRQIETHVLGDEIWRVLEERLDCPIGWIKRWLMLRHGKDWNSSV